LSQTEIPLLRESSAFVRRLAAAARQFGDSQYRFYRRVNWSHRFASAFYAEEAALFLRDDASYLAGRAPPPAPLADVFGQRLSVREVLNMLLKVLAHWGFAILGTGSRRVVSRHGVRVYRKCYVDDIELVFDPAEPAVLRAVYPFPLNLSRQLRYLRTLRRRRLLFVFAGNPYLPVDVWRLLRQRTVGSMMRLEARAAVLHAKQVSRWGLQTVQLSDEFNLGSLDFARTLARGGARVVNSAHGVGKYLPAHAYQEFDVLTGKQQEYYLATRPCEYRRRHLNDLAPAQGERDTAGPRRSTRLVFLSQTFPGLTGVVKDNEDRVVQRLHREFGAEPRVELHYKPHPTNDSPRAPNGFRMLRSIDAVNGRAGTMYVSQFSTCQIDPTFKGRKVLVRGHLIHPEISFDDDQEILTLEALVASVRSELLLAAAGSAVAAPQPARPALIS
jgi:hypothetical protein